MAGRQCDEPITVSLEKRITGDSTAEHGSRCGRLTSRFALLLYAARSTRQQWFADTGPFASVTSRCQSATAPGCIAKSARLHWPHRGDMIDFTKTAKALGLSMPQTLLLSADEVIE